MTDGIVKIHGKDYMTVAKRVELWLEENKTNNEGYSLETEVLSHTPVVVKAVIKYRNRTFTGISAVTAGDIGIAKQNPYEVAETSAVGRALGFAGFGIIEGIPSADEMHKATAPAHVPGLNVQVSKPAGNPEPVPWEDLANASARGEATAAVEKKLGITPQEAKDIEDSVAETENFEPGFCKAHGKELKERQDGTYDHRMKQGDDWMKCLGDGTWQSANF